VSENQQFRFHVKHRPCRTQAAALQAAIGLIHTMQRSTSKPGTINGST